MAASCHWRMPCVAQHQSTKHQTKAQTSQQYRQKKCLSLAGISCARSDGLSVVDDFVCDGTPPGSQHTRAVEKDFRKTAREKYRGGRRQYESLFEQRQPAIWCRGTRSHSTSRYAGLCISTAPGSASAQTTQMEGYRPVLNACVPPNPPPRSLLTSRHPRHWQTDRLLYFFEGHFRTS